jgi:Protein of unknown function (DUF2742)
MTASKSVASQQVSWWSVRELIIPVLNQVNDWPTLGTPAWCSLAHDDPRKWAALLDAAQHHALRLELNQEARADASKAVSGAVDWPRVSQEIRQLNDFREGRPWVRRAS